MENWIFYLTVSVNLISNMIDTEIEEINVSTFSQENFTKVRIQGLVNPFRKGILIWFVNHGFAKYLYKIWNHKNFTAA
jgi:hypothetical protein